VKDLEKRKDLLGVALVLGIMLFASTYGGMLGNPTGQTLQIDGGLQGASARFPVGSPPITSPGEEKQGMIDDDCTNGLDKACVDACLLDWAKCLDDGTDIQTCIDEVDVCKLGDDNDPDKEGCPKCDPARTQIAKK